MEQLNPIANAFPAACDGVSEQNNKMAFSSRIEDSPQRARGELQFILIRISFLKLKDAKKDFVRQLIIA